MRKRITGTRFDWLMILLSISALPTETNAAFECYNEKYFPAVFKLVETDKGIQAQLGGAYADLKRHVSPVLVYREGGGWTYVESRNCNLCEAANHDGKCQEKIPKWKPIPSEDRPCMPNEDCRQGIPVVSLGSGETKEIIEESPSSCAIKDNIVWFGINFYRGEGYTGYGGLGRYDRQTNKLELRRPTELKDVPIHKVVWDGERLWAATTSNYECIGHPPALGLIRYKWDVQEFTQYKGRDDGPCGFVIHDLLWSKGFLWVATDVGLSRWDAKSGQWTHYLPDVKSPEKVKEGRCEAFYRDLLDTLPRSETSFDETNSYYQIFYGNLKKFHPVFIRLYESR